MSLLTKFLFPGVLLFGLSVQVTAQKSWAELTTVEDVCEAYPERMATMLAQFDLDQPRLEGVKAAVEQDNIVEAGRQLLEYYRNAGTVQHLRRELPPETNKTVASADTTLNNVFVVQNVRGEVPYREDGHRDWYYKGPNNDREWAWLSNRHSQLLAVYNAYQETGNPKYVEYIDLFLKDFIIASLPYPAEKGTESIWRGLEVSFRAKVWSQIFYGLIRNENFSPATQLLILSSLPEHAHYNRNFHGGGNWLTMEISALATVATNFPEYREADEWLAYSIETMVESMKEQVYPDGVQTELTSHYHQVALLNFALFKDICDRAGQPLPDFYNQTLETMYGYLAHTMRPDGTRLLNNDGDRGSDRPLVLSGAEQLNRPEWQYVATNGASGTKPADGPSYFYPWAGHLVSRSGYGSDAQWSFFDLGPWGSGHQHNDKLHLSVSAYGRDLLVDAGRFAYTGAIAEKFRPYARGSAGHNLVLIDHQGQEDGPRQAEEPLGDSCFKITDEFDFASGAFESFINVEGEAAHQRSVFYVRGEFWVVVDRILTDRPREVDALWHWHPDCVVEKDGAVVKTNNDRGNLSVTPLGAQEFTIEFIQGQEEPAIQGWYSPEYNVFEPNVASIYRTTISSTTTFVWLLLPSEKETPAAEAEIVSEDDRGVTVAVRAKEVDWQLTIPFADSAGAKLVKN